jgi:hypothetical protein
VRELETLQLAEMGVLHFLLLLAGELTSLRYRNLSLESNLTSVSTSKLSTVSVHPYNKQPVSHEFVFEKTRFVALNRPFFLRNMVTFLFSTTI